MFRIELFVDDKKLPGLLIAITGMTLGAPTVQPVVNAAVKNGKVRATSSGSRVEMMMDYFKTQKLSEVGPSDIRDWCRQLGLSDKSYSNFLNKALGAKMLKRRTGIGNKYRYTVITKKEAAGGKEKAS